MKSQKKLFVGILLFVLTFAFVYPFAAVSAYDVDDINRNRATTKYKFEDKNASIISMDIEGRTETFKRETIPPDPSTALSGVTGQRFYKYVLVGDTDDNCRQGGSALTSGGPDNTVASINILSSAIDNNPDPDKIDATLLFFRKDGDRCTNRGVAPQIQVNNPFDAELKVPEAERAAAKDGDVSGENISCETSDSGPLGWIICPVIEGAATFTQFVFDNFVQPFLEDVPVTTSPTDGSYVAWKQFRLIGNIVLVGTMLAVVYAQVKGDR